MGRRTQSEQEKHDRRVKQEADRYRRNGWNVKADAEGYEQPDTVGSKNPRRPDIVATKPGTTHMVEVETQKGADPKQRETFRRSAGQRNRVKYREIFADE